MIANILIGIGAITGILGLLDGIILSDKQKKYLADRFLELWNWLDDAGKPLRFLSRAWVEWIGIVAGSCFELWRFSIGIIGEPEVEITITSMDNVPVGKAIVIPRDSTISDYFSHWLDFLLVFILLVIACWLSALLIVLLLKRPLAAKLHKSFEHRYRNLRARLCTTGTFVAICGTCQFGRPFTRISCHFVLFVPAGFIVISPILLLYLALALIAVR